MSKEQLLAGLNLKPFDKEEKVQPPALDQLQRENMNKQMKIHNQEETQVTPMRKWRAIAWSIIHFNWLYKIVTVYREKKIENEEKPLAAVIDVTILIIRNWLIEILFNLLSSTDRINLDIINDPTDRVVNNKSMEFSFRRLSVRVEGIVNILLDKTLRMPSIVSNFMKKIFREGGFAPQKYWTQFELKRLEFDDKQTLNNFSKERFMLCSSYMILTKVLVLDILMKPENIKSLTINRRQLKA